MSLPRHDPPGFVDDLTEANKQGWSLVISSFMDTERVNPKVTPNFYDATKTVEVEPIQTQTIVTWTAFPKRVKDANPNDRARWRAADAQRQVQDEYLEWSIKRDPNTNKILKIVFCNEGPEYIQYLADKQPDTLVKLYQDLHPGYDIQKEDLFGSDGVYIPENKWNSTTTTGTIMHLIQGANTLGAEVDLAGRATILRKDKNGNPITDKDQLCNCSDFGNPGRNSDPTIGAAVNSFSRLGYRLTLDNPIGLYIHEIDWTPVSPPAGHEEDDPSTFWTWTRGQDGYRTRGEFEVPADKGYVLGDLLINNKVLEFGGQVADLINVAIRPRISGPEGAVQTQLRFCGDNPTSPPLGATPAKALYAGASKHGVVREKGKTCTGSKETEY